LRAVTRHSVHAPCADDPVAIGKVKGNRLPVRRDGRARNEGSRAGSAEGAAGVVRRSGAERRTAA